MASIKDEEYLRINFARKDKASDFNLRYYVFTDGDFTMAYMPSLNLSGYGSTEQEATEMLRDIVMDYLVSLVQLPEAKALAELREYGWNRRPFLAKELRNNRPFSTDSIRQNFNLPTDTKFSEHFVAA